MVCIIKMLAKVPHYFGGCVVYFGSSLLRTGGALTPNLRALQSHLSYPACITLTNARQPNLSSASACVAS